MANISIKNNGNRVEAENPGKLNYDNDQDIANFVAHQTKSNSGREKLERQWYLNIAYFLGHQYLQWDPHARRLYLPYAPRHRQRIVVNRLMPIVRRIISMTIRAKPQWVVSPATAEIEDQITSQVATSYLKYMWRNLSMDDKLVDLIKWRSTCGNVFMRCFWDPHKGERVVSDVSEASGKVAKNKDDKKKLRKAGRKYLKKKGLMGPEDTSDSVSVAMGDCDVEVISPFHIYPDPNADTFDKAEWVVDVRQRSKEYVMERYGMAEEELGTGSDSNTKSYYQKQIRNLDSPTWGGSTGGQNSLGGDSDMVDVLSVYVKPTPKEPTGWWAVVVNDKVVRKDRNKKGYPTFPYVHVQEVPVSGRLWGSCVLEQAIPVQVAYNRARSQIIEHVNTVTRPAWLIPKGGGIKETSFTGEPGEKILYTWPMKPELSRPGDLPQTNHHNVSQLIRDMQDISSQHEAQQGMAPGRVDSGVGLASLMEQDDSILAPATSITASALSVVGSNLLKMASQMVDEERIIKIVGENHLIDVRHFKGQDLVGNNSNKAGVDYFDVTVEMGANLPLSPAARRELAISLAQFGILNPQLKGDKERILELLELKKDPTAISPGTMDVANARRENQEMAQGAISDIWEFDDDELHIDAHREFQKTPEYGKILIEKGGADGDIHQMFELHIAAHAERLQGSMSPPGPLGPEEEVPVEPEMEGGMMPPPPPGAMPGGMPGGDLPPEVLMALAQGGGPGGIPPGAPPPGGMPPISDEELMTIMSQMLPPEGGV